ncbi:hypothetical protein NESM_000242000 [Novymonas esmeraldas]|uniref:J domain-containing protein n=1 Tax=Novymonas esmeraldas TaxID=1808958 RepID=A0AAW0F5C4_9TRYP
MDSAASSGDFWPEVAPGDASKRAALRKKSLTTSSDQLLYLQALYPYAPYDELMAVIASTDGADEAARRAYAALNPDYTGYAYLKEQHDLATNRKLPSTQRATAFAGLAESLGERAVDAFRPGLYGNLSQLHEYHETMGLFIVDTSDWDRATLLPSRDLAEAAFMDLPLRERYANGESAATARGSSNNACGDIVDCNSDGDSDDDDNDDDLGARRRERSSRVGIVSLTMARASSTGFMDLHSRDTPHAAASTSLTGGDSRLRPCRTTDQPAQQQVDGPGSSSGGGGGGGATADGDGAGVVYLQNSDPPCAAPIIGWAPEAIRVGPAEARREREGALRVFDEATFFKDPLVVTSATQPPSPRTAARLSATNKPGDAVPAPPSPVQTRTALHFARVGGRESEVHEPFDLGSGTLPDFRGGENPEETFSAEETSGPLSYRRSHSHLPPQRLRPGQGGDDGDGDGDHAAADGTRRSSAADWDNASSSSVPHAQCSLRDVAREALKTRKPHPLTTTEKVRQRMRSLTPVGNLVFRESSLHTPVLSPGVERDSNRRQSVLGSPERAPLHLPGATALSAHSVTSHDTLLQRTHPSHHGAWADDTQAVGGDADDLHGERTSTIGTAVLPAAHGGCASLDPASFLNAEEERWNTIVMMLAPYEDVFGHKHRCELVRCIHDMCPRLRGNITMVLQRLLGVVGNALRGKQVAEGLVEEPLELPLFGPILLSTSPVKVAELVFREGKCSLAFCEEGTQLALRLDVRAMELEPIQFAFIDEAKAARQARRARQTQRRTPVPRSRAAAWTLRSAQQERYSDGVTRGTATIAAADIRIKGVVYVWLMASGKTHVGFRKADVSLGSFKVATTVTRLNVLCTLGAPIIRLMVQRAIQDALQGQHLL